MDVAENAGEITFSPNEVFADRHIQIDRVTILVPPYDFTAHADVVHSLYFKCENVIKFATAPAGAKIPVDITIMAPAMGFRHEHGNVLSDHFVAGITEKFFDDPVGGSDNAFVVDGDNAIHHVLNHGTSFFFPAGQDRIGPLQFSGAQRDPVFQFLIEMP